MTRAKVVEVEGWKKVEAMSANCSVRKLDCRGKDSGIAVNLGEIGVCVCFNMGCTFFKI